MLITKEQQEAMVYNYQKDHNFDEGIGFVDGMVAMIELMEKLSKPETMTFKSVKDFNGYLPKE